jgi:DHA1 family bicyclomycin/chloramphenicol resistance-like MFS transporter
MTSSAPAIRPSTRRLAATSAWFTLLLAGLATLSAFATDMSLPVLADTAATFGVPVGRAALTLSTFMIGFAVAPLLSGPISDHLGRRPVLLAGTALYAAAGVFATWSASLGALLVWRLLMGAGAGTGFVIVVAMVRDLFTGAEARVRQSYVNLAAGVAPVIAPTVGVVVAALGGWRAIYGVLAAGAAVLCVAAWFALDESLATERQDHSRVADHVARVTAGYARVLRQPVSVGFIVMVALNFGALFAYVSGSSLVLIGVLGVSKRAYGALFACTSLGLMVGALTNARLSRRGVPHHTLIAWGMATIGGTALVMLALSFSGAVRVAFLVPLAVLGFIGHGMVRPNVVQGALEPVPEVAGVASALMSAGQMVTGASVSALVSTFFDGRTAHSLTAVQALCATLSIGVYALRVRPRERKGAI